MTTIRHLKIFVTVAECNGMHKAAEVLYISQPSISQTIRELEEHYHVKLFERLSRRLYITEAGKQLLSYARHILGSLEEMDEAMLRAGAAPVLKIGGSVTVGTVLLGALIRQLEDEIPGIDVRVTVDNTASIEQLICRSELDLAIVEGSLSSEDLEKKFICKDEIQMVVGKSHPLFMKKEITLDMLNKEALLSRESGSTERNQFEQFMLQHNIHMKKKWCCTNTEAIKNAVISGAGIAILSEKLVQKEIADEIIHPLNIKGVHVNREMQLIYHKNKYLSPQMETFIRIAETADYSASCFTDDNSSGNL